MSEWNPLPPQPMAQGLRRLLLQAPLSIAIGYGAINIVAAAWSSCDNYEPPYGFGLVWVIWPLLSVLSWLAFGLSVALIGLRPLVGQLAAGVVLSLALLSWPVQQLAHGIWSACP